MNETNIQYTAASDKGQRRINQDNLCVGDLLADVEAFFEKNGQWTGIGPLILCVCDGIGGGSMGDTAALLALKGVQTVARTATADENLEELVLSAADEAHKRVCHFFRQSGQPGGCTMALVAIRRNEFAFLNIGDSPAFLLHSSSRTLVELSCRHNLEWHKRRRGIAPLAADDRYLMRYIGKDGTSVSIMAHTLSGVMSSGDRMLLCSDGIVSAFAPQQLYRALEDGSCAASLVKQSAAIPGADNCTAIIFTVC